MFNFGDNASKLNLFFNNSSSSSFNSSDKVKIYTPQFPNGIKVTPEQMEEYKKSDMFKTYPIYAICLDTSSAKVLTGMHMPTMTLYTQEYID